MAQENKELLMKDLSCRIPYGVIVNVNGLFDSKLTSVSCYGEVGVNDGSTYLYPISEVKPYLFPLSSMTDKQYNEFFNYYHNIEIEEIKASGDYLKAAYLSDGAKYEWLNRNNFDWRYLIEKRLAIDCTDLNIY